MTKFIKSHGLGNDYIVIDGKDTNYSLTKSQVKKICHRNYGIGSDGVLLLCKSNKADFGLKIFNPDGSQAEKSGNGLRIFSAFLYEYKKIKKNKKITIETQGGLVASEFVKEIAGKKYIKVFFLEYKEKCDYYNRPAGYSAGSVHCFIDKQTGEVYKPASWKAPAKHVRFDLRLIKDREFLFNWKNLSWAGGHLYMR